MPEPSGNNVQVRDERPKDIQVPQDVFDSLNDDDFKIDPDVPGKSKSEETNTDDPAKSDKDTDKKTPENESEESQKEQPEGKTKGNVPPEKKKNSEKSETDEPTDVDNDNADDNEDTDEEPETEMSEESFLEKSAELLKKFTTDEQRQQFLKDVENWDRFFATNTQKSQQIAEKMRQAESLIDQFGAKPFLEAVKNVTGHEDLKEFMESADEYFDGKDKNPFRPLIDSLKGIDKIKESVDQHVQQRTEISEKESLLNLKEEILALREFDPVYKDEKKINELAEFADKYPIPIDLITAAKLQASNTQQSKIKDLQGELKERNKIIKELRERLGNPQPEKDVKKSGKSANKTTYDEPPKDDEELHQRMSETWDELMAE